MPNAQSLPQNHRKDQTKVKARLTLYWKPEERAQLQAMIKDLGVSPYRYVKDCVLHLSALLHALNQDDVLQLWNTLFGISQKYAPFELNIHRAAELGSL